MKKTNSTILILLMLFTSITSAQLVSLDDLHQQVPYGSYVNQNFCVKIYVHRIGKDDGTGALTDNQIGNPGNVLNSFYNGGISFNWDGQIREVNDTEVYDSNVELSSTGPLGQYTYDFDLLDNYSNEFDDGIHIFIHARPQLGSLADGIGNKPRILLTPSHLTNLGLAHEVGHVLGLFHTHHGTAGDGSNFGENADGYLNHQTECPGSPDGTKGDYVSDTTPDTGEYSVSNTSCFASTNNDSNYCGGVDFPTADLRNIMRVSSKLFECGASFSDGQINRMKYFLSTNLSILTDTCRADLCNTNPCDIIADFSTNINDCNVNFNGVNNGVYCPSQIYTWVISNSNNEVIWTSSDEDFNYTFPYSGNYNVSFTINNPNGGKGCSNTTTQLVSVTCEFVPPPPSCPSNLELYVLENCEDAQVYLNANAGVAYVDFYYTLGSYSHVYLGTTTGNSANQFAYPIYMPDPPSSGSWNGYVMSAYAVTTMDDGTVCDEILVRQRLSCSTGQWWRSNINVHPNPAKPNSELQFEGIDAKDVKSIELFDMFGNSKMKLNPKRSSFKIPELQSGLYIVKFYTSKGIEQKKLIIE